VATERIDLERTGYRLVRVRDASDAKAELHVTRLTRIAFFSNREVDLPWSRVTYAPGDTTAIIAGRDRHIYGAFHRSSIA
jgi:hypothetical protein